MTEHFNKCFIFLRRRIQYFGVTKELIPTTKFHSSLVRISISYYVKQHWYDVSKPGVVL